MFKQSPEIYSRLSADGVLTVRLRSAEDGRILRTIIKQNTIVDSARTAVFGLLLQRATDPAASELQLGSMRFGRSGIAAATTDINLIEEVSDIRKQLVDANKINNGLSITLQATVEAGEGNGYTYREAGLFTRGGGLWNANVGSSLMMFARQVHAGIEKTDSFALDYNWTIQFSLN